MENDTTTIESTESELNTTEGADTGDTEGQALEAEAQEEAKAPAWVEFNAALSARAVALGLHVQEQASFTKFINMETGHKLYVAKQGRVVKRVDTTLPILGQDGTVPLSKPNGKIECHVIPEIETVTKVLTQLADSAATGKLRAAKRAPKAVEAEGDAPAETVEATE